MPRGQNIDSSYRHLLIVMARPGRTGVNLRRCRSRFWCAGLSPAVMARLDRAIRRGTVPRRVARSSLAMTIGERRSVEAINFGRRIGPPVSVSESAGSAAANVVSTWAFAFRGASSPRSTGRTRIMGAWRNFIGGTPASADHRSLPRARPSRQGSPPRLTPEHPGPDAARPRQTATDRLRHSDGLGYRRRSAHPPNAAAGRSGRRTVRRA